MNKINYILILLFLCAFSPVSSTVTSTVTSTVDSIVVEEEAAEEAAATTTTYASWSPFNDNHATDGQTYIVPLNDTDIAVLEAGVTDELYTLRWGGSSWSQVGNALAVSANNSDFLCKMTAARVVWINHSPETLHAYEWDGSDWSSIGNSFDFEPSSGVSNCTYLSDNRIAVFGNDNPPFGFAAIDFDGTDFTQDGNLFSISGNTINLVGLSEDRLAVHDTNSETIQTYDFDGSDWSTTGNALSVTAGSGRLAPGKLAEDKIIYFDGDNSQVIIFDGTDWSEEGYANTVPRVSTNHRKFAILTSTLAAYFSLGDADIRAYQATLDGDSTDTNTYASWATTGSSFSADDYTYIAPLNGTDIAVLEANSTNTLATLRWGGSSFSQVGNTLSVSGGTSRGIVKMSTTRAAILDNGTNQIQAYDWDGTDWATVGNAFSITLGNYPNGDYLSDNSIAVWTNGTIVKLDFDGTDFSQDGSAFTATGNYWGITALSSTRILAHSTLDDDLRVLDWGGSSWSQTGNKMTADAFSGVYLPCGVSSTQAVYFDQYTSVQTLTFDGTDITNQGGQSVLTDLGSWPRSCAKMSDTLVAYSSWAMSGIRTATATLQ